MQTTAFARRRGAEPELWVVFYAVQRRHVDLLRVAGAACRPAPVR